MAKCQHAPIYHVRQSLAEVPQSVAVEQEVDGEIEREHCVREDECQLEPVVGLIGEPIHEIPNELDHHGGTDEHEEEADDQGECDRRAVEQRVPSRRVAAGSRAEAVLTVVDDDEEAHVAEGECQKRHDVAKHAPDDGVRVLGGRVERHRTRGTHVVVSVQHDAILEDEGNVEDDADDEYQHTQHGGAGGTGRLTRLERMCDGHVALHGHCHCLPRAAELKRVQQCRLVQSIVQQHPCEWNQEVRHQTNDAIHHVRHSEEYQTRRRRLLDVALPVAHALSREHDEVDDVSGYTDRENDRMYYGLAVVLDVIIVQLFHGNVHRGPVVESHRCVGKRHGSRRYLFQVVLRTY